MLGYNVAGYNKVSYCDFALNLLGYNKLGITKLEIKKPGYDTFRYSKTWLYENLAITNLVTIHFVFASLVITKPTTKVYLFYKDF